MENGKLMIKDVSLRDGAILISDVHYKKGDKDFLSLLNDFIKNPPPQIFFLGDIFHALLPFKFLYEVNKEAINLINKLANKCEVYYAYGNHDFLIDKFFEGVIFADIFIDRKKSFILTHGDLTDIDLLYLIYLKIIRKKAILNFLNVVSLNFLYPWVFKMVLHKKINCDKIMKFKKKVLKKIADIKFENIIEGHYHQNVNFVYNNKRYFNLGSFFCERSFYLYSDNELKEVKYGR